MSRAKGFKHSKETIEKMRNWVRSDSMRAKLSKGKLGDKNPAKRMDVRQKISKALTGRKLSEETKEKMRGRKGTQCYNWIADRSKLAKLSNGNEYRNSPAYKEWSRGVRNRDGWKCKISNDDCCGRLEAHHILGYSEHPELRYSLNNGITLCHAHHPRVRSEEKRLSPYFQSLVSVSKV